MGVVAGSGPTEDHRPLRFVIPETCLSGEDISSILCGLHGRTGVPARRPPGRRQEAGWGDRFCVVVAGTECRGGAFTFVP
jgi:hypothetical protein